MTQVFVEQLEELLPATKMENSVTFALTMPIRSEPILQNAP